MKDQVTNEEFEKCLQDINQAFLEIAHAQRNGPSWYTRGENGMYQQVSMWLSRGFDATERIKQISGLGK